VKYVAGIGGALLVLLIGKWVVARRPKAEHTAAA